MYLTKGLILYYYLEPTVEKAPEKKIKTKAENDSLTSYQKESKNF